MPYDTKKFVYPTENPEDESQIKYERHTLHIGS